MDRGLQRQLGSDGAFWQRPEQAYRHVRSVTRALMRGLSDADATVQSMEDASPAKWHLAHTSWFFEAFVLRPFVAGYRDFDAYHGFLFNSYYDAVGARHPRAQRGLLTRPALEQVLDYRDHVDAAIHRLLGSTADPTVLERIELGLHHEQQHQELLLTDLLHLFSMNPLSPVYLPASPAGWARAAPPADGPPWTHVSGGVVAVGAGGAGFAFDCERPRHDVLLQPFRLARLPVLNGEWLAFMEDGGYATPALWLADGWAEVQREGWAGPLYWRRRDGSWMEMTLRGVRPVDPLAPVCHVSFFEADAFARWAGKRLPTEFEWECAAAEQPVAGNFADSGQLHPDPPAAVEGAPFAALFGDVWEWTASDFGPYPRFQPGGGAIGEYNGKFMNGQRVLRGGSCVTPAGHVGATYRSFFQPGKRWQFSGLRLAEDS